MDSCKTMALAARRTELEVLSGHGIVLGLRRLEVDAGGGSQIYPDDYAIIEELHKRGEMTVRMAYNIFTQKPKQEKEDFLRCMKLTGPGKGDDFYRCNGAGEMLVY